MSKSTVLYSPKGEKYETSNRAEITRLVAAGYSEKRPTPTQIRQETGESK